MAARPTRPDGLDLAHMQPVRTSSFSSDMMSSSVKSTGTTGTVHQPPHANPPPAYIAQATASDLLSTELDRRMVVSKPALDLLNEFLDHVLYSIISTAQSTTLAQLKAAVPIVLKPRLGKSALRFAEEELKEYIEDEEAEEVAASRLSAQPRNQTDVDLVWKLARLRCMVYARTGDLEEEDEEEWLEKEHLLDQAATSPTDSRQSLAVAPGAAIFLTSIIEYLGEQALYYAAQYTQKRHENARVQDAATPSPEAQLAARHADIVLEGRDMNHVGRDSPLSRLWRSWRRNTRSPIEVSSRSMSPDGLFSPATDSIHSRNTSFANQPIHPILEEKGKSRERLAVIDSPRQIPLPMTDDDVEEIEAREVGSDNHIARRPVSLPHMPGRFPSEFNGDGPIPPGFQERSPLRPTFERHRSNSTPLVQTPFDTSTGVNHDEFVLPIQNHEADSNEPVETISTASQDYVNGAGNAEDHAMEPEGLSSKDATGQPSRQKATPSPEELNETVGVLAGALGAVGVHHVSRKAQSRQIDPAEVLPREAPSPSEVPLTSASIKGKKDFAMMFVPEGAPSPDEVPKSQITKSLPPELDAQPKDPYNELRLRQYEDHKRYSLQSHEMDTPSIYSHREHSPRFPKDMRMHSRQVEELERPVIADTSALERIEHLNSQDEPQQSVYAANRREPSMSATSGGERSSMQRPTSTNPVPDLPQTRIKYQDSDERTPARDLGHSKSSSSSSRLLGFTRDPSGRPQTIHQQMAAGDMTEEMRRAHSSTPNSMNRTLPEPPQPVSPPRRQHMPIRADSENNAARHSPGDGSKRSLEDMINSDETLHYTLTPATANFREEDINPSPKRTSTQELADFFKKTAPPGQENATPKPMTRSRKVSMEAGRAPQPLSGPRERKGTIPSSKEVMIQQPTTVPKMNNPLGEPRSARVDRTSGVRDLADYVRSTGPSNEEQLPGPLATRAPVPSVAPAVAPASPVKAPTSSTLGRKRSNRLRARDPRPSRNAESSALIDFIREGPPRAPGEHRINRHVAPFRTTMDSDDLNGLVSSIPTDSSEGPRAPSIATTSNSHTPLVSHEAKMGLSQSLPQVQVQGQGQGQPPLHARTVIQPDHDDSDAGAPKRTRRRVKDPYAISLDSDDEDAHLFNEPVPTRQPNEESLIDFLRNTAPSLSMTAQPILPSPPPQQQNRSKSNRTPSTDKLKDFVRNKSTTPALDKDRERERATERQTQSRARAESPHLTQTGKKLDSYRPTQATHASHVDRNRANKTQTQTSAAAAGGDAGGKGVGATADLADYLRNTGPSSESTGADVQPFVLNGRVNGVKNQENSGGGGLKKFFSKRRR